MKIFVSGSLAYDIILDYPGKFADHIAPGKVHVLSLSFLVRDVKKSVGGTAGNIVYNLAMLGLDAVLLGSVGEDGKEILQRYKDMSIDIRLSKISKQPTAAAYIMTDSVDNQVAGFHPGAMSEKIKLPHPEACDWPVIAPENPANMIALARHYQKLRMRYIFDPGQQSIALSKKDLEICMKGASILIGNDYEIEVINKKLRLIENFRPKNLGQSMIVRTLGPKGSEIILPNGKIIKIGVVKARAVDPTGAGDAYRAGLIAGIVKGLDLKRAGQLGATAAAFAVEKYGTQNHRFTYKSIVTRHNRYFADKIS